MSKGEKVKQLLREGKNYGEIRRELNVAASTISYHAKRIGIGKELMSYDWDDVQKYYDQGNIIKDVISKFGMHRATWHKAIKSGKVKTCDTPERKALLKKSRKHSSGCIRSIPDNEFFIQNSTVGGSAVRKRIRKHNTLEYYCSNEKCTLYKITEPSWCGEPIVLHLDHINGTSNDHRLINLRWLCPNCHSQTKTYCRGNINLTADIDCV